MHGLITAVYGVSGVCAVAVYVPQIITAWKNRKDPKALSLSTWGLWVGTSSVSVTYAAVVAQDIPYTLISLGNLLGCGSVFIIAMSSRLRRYIRRARVVTRGVAQR